MSGNYDVEHLILLVRRHPVLWNKTLDTYKDKLLTRKAWHDICCELDNEFELRTEEERQEYARDVMKKWWNVRDNYVKICKKMAISPIPVKKYVYHHLLEFLPINGKKIKKELIPDVSQSTVPEETFHSDNSGDDFKKPLMNFVKKRKLAAPSSSATYKRLELIPQTENRHLSFFRGVLPSLQTFDDDDVIQFQMGVLQLIADIKSSKRMSQMAQQASSSTFTTDDDGGSSPPIKIEYNMAGM